MTDREREGKREARSSDEYMYNVGCCVCIGYTPRCRWLWNLSYRGPVGHELEV